MKCALSLEDSLALKGSRWPCMAVRPYCFDCRWAISLQDDVYDHIEKICDVCGLCMKMLPLVNSGRRQT